MPQTIAIMAGGSIPEEYDFYSQYLKKANYIIAADAGLNVLYYANILPNLWVGDGDSVGKKEWEWVLANHISVRKYPCDKSATDTEIAMDVALSLAPEQIWILGAIGSRLDHTLGNLFLLEYAYQRGRHARLIHPYHTIQILTPTQPILIVGTKDDILSIIPITETIVGLNLEGVHWTLTQASIQRGPTMTISNRLESEHATLSLKQGLAFVVQAKEKLTQ